MKSLVASAFRKTAVLLITLLGVTSLTFVLLTLPHARDQDAEVFTKDMPSYLDRNVPLTVRYIKWTAGVLTLDWGVSSRDNQPVLNKLLARLPATVMLNFFGVVLAFIIGIPLGVIAAWKHGSQTEKVMSWMSFLLYSTPSYFLALLLILLFSIHLPDWTDHLFGVRWNLPISGIRDPLIPDNAPFFTHCIDRLRHALLPIITLSIFAVVHLQRFTKAAILEIKDREWILAARTRGISPWNLYFKHCLKNALPPILTMAFLMVPALLGASFIVEIVFAWPGIGFLTYRAVWERDFAMIMGGVTMTAVMTLLATSAADCLSKLTDPRQ